MSPIITALLFMGLSLGSRSQVQPGTFPKPQLWAVPGSVIPWGKSITLWCAWGVETQECRLAKVGSPEHRQTRTSEIPMKTARFSITSMTQSKAGQYRCYYHSPTGWPEYSDIVELVVTGLYPKPSLSAVPSPVVTSGGNITLQCSSQRGFDSFILTEEGDKRSWIPPQYLRRKFQALFAMGPIIPNHSWTFRCYGSVKKKSQVWSEPSDALELLISGGPEDQRTTPASGPQGGPARHLKVLTGVPVASVSLLFLILVLVLRHQRKSKSRTADVTVRDTKPEDQVELDTQAAAHEGPHDVTYAQLCSRMLRQGPVAPPSLQDGVLPDEPSVYAVLLATCPGTFPKDSE